jgi:hypothetical protein
MNGYLGNQPHGRPASSTDRHIFAQCFAHDLHAPGARETLPRTGTHGTVTHPWYTLPMAHRQQVRPFGSHPLTRSSCEPSRRLPARLPRKVTRAGVFQASGFQSGFHQKQAFDCPHWDKPAYFIHGVSVVAPPMTSVLQRCQGQRASFLPGEPLLKAPHELRYSYQLSGR